MIKTLQNTLKQDREGFVLPKSVQDAIPIRRLWPDGIFQFGSKFSKTIRFSDINYAIASKEDKTSMFLGYSELLNALDTGSTTKLTINNKRLNRQDFEQKILLPRQDDYLDGYRAEYNAMLMDKVTDSSNSVAQERYITLSVHRKSVEEARTFFDRVTADVTTRLSHLDAHSEELDAVERLRVLHDFYRTGEETEFHVDLRDLMRKGHSFKDSICPDSLEFKKDYFVMGDKFGRVLFLKEYASYIKDSMISELTALNRTMMLSIDVIPVPTDEAVREMQNRLLGVETNVTNWQRRQNSNNNFSAVVPYDLEQQRKETREMLDDLTTRDQRMMFAVVTLVHLADSKEELDSDTDALQSAARKHLCQLSTLNWQQADGLVTALPLGLRRIDALRTLTTEALAVLMPFKAQEVRDQGGVYYGQNVISKNLIIANRKELLNGNGFVLGVSGSGKSFTAKREMVNLALSTEDDIIVIDPESEYRPLIEGLGGEVVNISATSPNHINAMDMEQGYGDGENPVVLKSEFLLSLCEQLMGDRLLSAKEKSIIDRCTANVYHSYIKGGYQGKAPTLQDFHAELLRQSEPEARDVALAIELFTEGSLNTFAKPTNVDTDARILCYDIRDLGKQLLPVGMLVVLDSVFNRVIRNRALGRNTWVYIDEIYLLFQHEYSANFLFTLWKRVRKYGACCTGLTQNVDDLLQSHTARTMLANSEFLVMLNQAATDRAELARLLNISDNQLSYITNLAFCCHKVTVITDFSDLEQIGWDHRMVITGGDIPAEDYPWLDNRKAALTLIENQQGTVTPYGVVYDNGMVLEPHYGGQELPAFPEGSRFMALDIIPDGEFALHPPHLYLPAPMQQIERMLLRAGVDGLSDAQLFLDSHDFPEKVAEALHLKFVQGSELPELNRLCQLIAPLQTADRKKLDAVVLMTEPQNAYEICQLAENLDQFDFIPKVQTPEEYGRYVIQKSGRFLFDGQLHIARFGPKVMEIGRDSV